MKGKQRKKEITKRKRFTEDEDKYIRRGVRIFAVPDEQIPWAEIKEYYSRELIDRTTINIKDRWRTLNEAAGRHNMEIGEFMTSDEYFIFLSK